MTKVLKAITGLLLAVTVANAGWQSYEFYQTFSPGFAMRDAVWQIDNRLAQTRKELLALKVERIGYRSTPGVPWEDTTTDLYWVQYAVAPIVVRQSLDNAGEDWVMMGYSPAVRPFTAPDLVCIEDFGNGIALHKKSTEPPARGSPLDLGSVWQVKEGPFTGTWTRRELTDTFDAVWMGPGGQKVTDEIRFESADCGRIILFRTGTKGRYHGKLSTDRTRIENGTAEWFEPEHTWSATIGKMP
jgi:hypothetical protein